MAPQREWIDHDYYETLGVAQGASDKEITSAYRSLAKQFHPDANRGDAAAEERFKEVSAAYDVLGDSAKRKEYDDFRKLAQSGAFGAGPGAGGFGPGGAGGFAFEGDLGDLLGGLFGGAGGTRARRGARASHEPTRGADLETELHLDFLDAIHGVTTTVHFASDVACSECHGSGARPGTFPETCPECSGSGSILVDQGPFSFSQVCPRCGGRGQVVKEPCPRCKGRGVEHRRREVRVRVPPGVADGGRIRVKQRGAAGRYGGPAGDLYVVVHVRSHPVFGRNGKNLTVTVPVTFPEAALGAQVPVPTLDGRVTVKVPPGTRSGRTVRVRGRGIPQTKGGAGDLMVTFDVAVPAKATKAQKAAIAALGDVLTEDPRGPVRRGVMAMPGSTDDRAVYVISVAAELAGLHPQTLRIYERKGLIEPQRTEGRNRRYSDRDIAMLRQIQALTTAGVNLAGVQRIIELETQVAELRAAMRELQHQLDRVQRTYRRELVPLRQVRDAVTSRRPRA